jgi:hypothetical protein
VGDAQIEWLKADLAKRDKSAPVIVLTHRPAVRSRAEVGLGDARRRAGGRGAAAISERHGVLRPYHQENHHMTSHIAHHAAKSLIFPLPAPGSQERRAPLAWNPAGAQQRAGHSRHRGGAGTGAIHRDRTSGQEQLSMRRGFVGAAVAVRWHSASGWQCIRVVRTGAGKTGCAGS